MVKIREHGLDASSKFRKVFSGEAVFAIPEEISGVEFNPSTLLEDNQWYFIEKFSETDFCYDIFKSDNFDSVDYEQLDSAQFEKIDFLFECQTEVYFFQNIPKSQLIRKKRLCFGNQFQFDQNDASIILKEIADAIYLKRENRLYFRKLSSISSIFPGIAQLYREATETETAEFLHQEFISLAEGFSSADVKVANRKRIALALDILNNLRDEEKNAIFYYIKGYCPDLVTSDDSLSIGNENDLKLLLYGIEEKYYTTPVGREKRIANSIVRF